MDARLVALGEVQQQPLSQLQGSAEGIRIPGQQNPALLDKIRPYTLENDILFAIDNTL